ncbi:MAG TPA: asparagine synthase (glutamine-hydrolyzing) [Sphingomicrobium sp.]
MCGIAGILSPSAPSAELLERMGRALAHRGPDDEGAWLDAEAGVGLANRRLAIIDLSPAGHQPIHSSDGRFVLTFNGEIYNHRDLRSELEQRGGVPEGGWRGHSDTEALVEAISHWGLKPTLDRCVGQFAFALWDRRERRLSLVRDRFGEKPLYYGWAGDDFLFASELKAIRLHPNFSGAIDRRALRLFAARTYIPAPLSIYRGIYKLQPGCILELSRETRAPADAPTPESSEGLSLTRYWSYRDVLREGLRNPIEDESEAIGELERVLARAVESQSLADVPVGAFLSGGIDSSAVVALYQKYSATPVRTFTIGFAEEAFNEADHARAVARHFRTEHHEQIVTAREAQDVIPKLPQLYDEPFADSSQIPTYLVSRFARQQVKVALSGDGGDELFGGYNRYFGTARLWSRLKLLPAPVRAAAAASGGLVPAAAWDRLGKAMSGKELPPFFGVKVRKSLKTVAAARNLEDLFASFIDEWPAGGSPVLGDEGDLEACSFDLDLGEEAPDALRMMYCDAASYLPDDILCKVDRASMAASLEAHAPYLDHRVAELAARIPLSMKIEGNRGKLILKKLLFREAPPELFERPKSGFAIPVGEWIKGPLRDWAEDLLDPAAMRTEGWFDPNAVARRWKEHLSGKQDSTAALWAVLTFQAWLREQRVETAAAA